MLICVPQPWNQHRPGQRRLIRAFARRNPLVSPPTTPASLYVVDYPLFLVA